MVRNLRPSEKQLSASRSRSSKDTSLARGIRVTEILDLAYRVVREIQGVELRLVVEILDLADEVVVKVKALEFALVFQVGDLANTVAL